MDVLGLPIRAPRRSMGSSLRTLGSVVLAVAVLLTIPLPASAAPTPSITINDVSVTEGNSGTTNAVFTIQVSPRPRNCCPLQVNWATANGTATAGTDYIASSGTVTLTRTAYSKTVTVPVVGDTLYEPNMTFFVNLSNLVGSPGVIGRAQGVGTIVDDDPPPALSVNDVSVMEGDAGTTSATFTASLSVVSGKSVTFDWATADGTATAGVDYVSSSGSGLIPAGSTSTTFDVPVIGDTIDEDDKTFSVSLSNVVDATVADGEGLGTIIDDDPLPVLSIGDVSVLEGDAGTTTATFPVSLSPGSGRTVTVDWATADGTATAPSDYLAGSGTLTFAAGTTSKTIDVTVNGDTLPELDETFSVTLSNATNAVIGDAVGTGTILDDELEPVIFVDDPSVTEGDAGTTSLDFTVGLSNPGALPVTVDWTTVPGTAVGGTDYLEDSGSVTFAPSETSKTVRVTVYGNTTYERDKTVLLELSNPTNAPIGKVRGIGTILNDDPAPTISVAGASVLEGNSGTTVLSFAVSLVGDSALDATVDFATSDVTATAGVDYVAASGTLTIPAGSTSGTIDVVVIGDTIPEGNRTFSLTLSNPTDAAIGEGSATGKIIEDDKWPTSLTLKVVKKPLSVIAKGLLNPTQTGHRVIVTYFKKQNGRFVKITSKTVSVKAIKDRNGDGLNEGTYLASFARPKAGGTYRFVARFKGATLFEPCSRSKTITLTAR